MGIQIHPFDGTTVAFVRCEDVVTLQDMVSVMTDFTARNDRKGQHVAVVDLTPTIDVDLSFQEVRRFLPYLHLALADSQISFQLEIAAPSAQTRTIATLFQLLTRSMDRVAVTIHDTVSGASEAAGLGPSQLLDFAAHPVRPT